MRAMKDSGAEWIGEIPETAVVTRVGRVYKSVLGKMLCDKQPSEDATLEYYYCAGNVHFDGIESEDLKQMWFTKTEKANYLVREGDLLIVEGGAGAGGAYVSPYSDREIYVQNSIHIVRPLYSEANNKFLYYSIFSLVNRSYIDFVCNKATIPHFTKEKLHDVPVVIFSDGVTKSIVGHLDKKSAQIDAIIEKQQRVIEKLKEYKQSVITEAVTKGLDPTVPMKGSGVEWIGLVPEKWEKVRIKTYTKLKTGTTPPTTNQEFFDGDYNWFTPSDFSDTLVLNNSSRKVNYMVIDLGIIPEFDAGSVLLVAIGATLGKVGYVNEKCSSNQQITAITPVQKVSGKYLAYYLRAMMNVVRDYALYTTLPIINNQTLGTFWYALPSEHEQALIIERLDAICENVENCIKKKLSIIERLTDYKKSLIYEAVTGKMEV